MFGHPKGNFLPKKASMNFEVYGQGPPITPEAGENKGSFFTGIQLTNCEQKENRNAKSSETKMKNTESIILLIQRYFLYQFYMKILCCKKYFK